MAKLGPYTYPDIRFGDAVEIAGRILTKFKGTVSVKGLAWELGMAEGSGTLFAKVAAMRDFGLIEGRGELRVSPLAQRVLHPGTTEEGQEARAEAFQRVELLRQLYTRFEGEVPDDMSMLVGLEEITRSARDEIVRRAPLIQKHLTDAIRVLGRPVVAAKIVGTAVDKQELSENILKSGSREPSGATPLSIESVLEIVAGGRKLSVPLTAEYIDVAIRLLATLKAELPADATPTGAAPDEDDFDDDLDEDESTSTSAADIELGTVDQLDMPGARA